MQNIPLCKVLIINYYLKHLKNKDSITTLAPILEEYGKLIFDKIKERAQLISNLYAWNIYSKDVAFRRLTFEDITNTERRHPVNREIPIGRFERTNC